MWWLGGVPLVQAPDTRQLVTVTPLFSRGSLALKDLEK